MPDFPYLDRAGLKPYDATYTVLSDNRIWSEHVKLEDAIASGKLCSAIPVMITCELRGTRSQIKRFTMTLDQAIKLCSLGRTSPP